MATSRAMRQPYPTELSPTPQSSLLGNPPEGRWQDSLVQLFVPTHREWGPHPTAKVKKWDSHVPNCSKYDHYKFNSHTHTNAIQTQSSGLPGVHCHWKQFFQVVGLPPNIYDSVASRYHPGDLILKIICKWCCLSSRFVGVSATNLCSWFWSISLFLCMYLV